MYRFRVEAEAAIASEKEEMEEESDWVTLGNMVYGLARGKPQSNPALWLLVLRLLF